MNSLVSRIVVTSVAAITVALSISCTSGCERNQSAEGVQKGQCKGRQADGATAMPQPKVKPKTENNSMLVNRDLSVKELRRIIMNRTSSCYASCVSPDGETLVLQSDEDCLAIQMYDLSTGDRKRSLDRQQQPQALAFSSDGKSLLSGGWGKFVTLWDIDTGKPLRRFPATKSEITCVGFSAGGSRVVAGAEDIIVWDRETGNELGRYQLAEVEKAAALGVVEGRPVVAVVTRQHKAGFRTNIRLVDLEKGQDLHGFPGPSPCNAIVSIAFVPGTENAVIIYCLYRPTLLGLGPPHEAFYLEVWRMTDGSVLYHTALKYQVETVSCLPDGQSFVLAGYEARLWQLYDK